MKILIIAKTIHPTLSPRAFRATELACELGHRGHDVVLYANLGTYDYCRFQEENNVKVRDIGAMVFSIENSDGMYPGRYHNKALRRLLGRWTELPDIEFIWKVPSVLRREKNVDFLITIGMPYAIHWGTAWYRSRHKDDFPSVWVGDCGDPFMGNQFQNPPSYFGHLEKLFCREADYITIPIEEARPAYDEACQDKIQVIPQGFRFDLPDTGSHPDNAVPTFLYAGNFYPPARDPRPFLSWLTTREEDFRFTIHTRDRPLIAPYQQALGERLNIEAFIPRKELLKKMKMMDFLVNFDNGTEIHSPSKLIDYAITGRPILQVNSQQVDQSSIVEFLDGNYTDGLTIENIDRYRIENVVDQFLTLYENKVNQTV